MCCYKLVTIKFHVFGLETRIQQFIDKVSRYIVADFNGQTQRNLFLRLNKQVICTLDDWIGLDVEAIRSLEQQVQCVLEEKIKSAKSADKDRLPLTETPGH